ncbi:MAG TPA: hypothetical protein EYP49_17220, partial [Anaerolineae bacterium]|nr:hypothetical protein [Anaerolineae bacterium]
MDVETTPAVTYSTWTGSSCAEWDRLDEEMVMERKGAGRLLVVGACCYWSGVWWYVPPLVIHSLPFEDDMETPETNWRWLNGFAPTTTTAHSGVTSWGSDVPESALQLVDRLDLTDATEPVLTFWQRFDLPAGSLGTVEVSTDGGFTWAPVYTQAESLSDWTPITVDLSAYAGQEVALAFYLREVGAGGVAQVNDTTMLAQSPVQSHTPPYAGLSMLPFLGLADTVGFVGLRQRGKSRRLLLTIAGLAVSGLTLSACIPCVRVGPGPGFDYDRLDEVLGQVELVVPAEARTLHARLSPDGRWLWIGHWRDENLGCPYSLIDLKQNQLYENFGKGTTPAMWPDNEHIAIGLSILRVSDMTRWKLQVIKPPQGSLGELAGASHIYAVDMGSTYWLMTTDPALPYVITSEFGASPGRTNERLEAFLADMPHTIITRDSYWGNRDPAYLDNVKLRVEAQPRWAGLT